LLFSQAWA